MLVKDFCLSTCLMEHQHFWVILGCLPEKGRKGIEPGEKRNLFVLRFYGQVNPIGSCRMQSVYITILLLFTGQA